MNDEILEHKLSLLRHTPVILVCPQYGTVSMSYAGTLYVGDHHPVIFQLVNETGAVAILFTVSDVNKLEYPDVGSVVVRLKGPHDYKEDYSKV